MAMVTDIELKEKRELAACRRKEMGKEMDKLSGIIASVDYELAQRQDKWLRGETGVEVYRAGDYAGLSVGKYKFYFGYESTMCLEHVDCSCEDNEWCFTADVDDVEVMRVPESGLGQKDVILNLLHGIGQFLSKR